MIGDIIIFSILLGAFIFLCCVLVFGVASWFIICWEDNDRLLFWVSVVFLIVIILLIIGGILKGLGI